MHYITLMVLNKSINGIKLNYMTIQKRNIRDYQKQVLYYFQKEGIVLYTRKYHLWKLD